MLEPYTPTKHAVLFLKSGPTSPNQSKCAKLARKLSEYQHPYFEHQSTELTSPPHHLHTTHIENESKVEKEAH
ncbi:uncharacterized protein EAF02_010331 [Botrytis sinoallii]|uniref:uncharacterized protein n=1 Tax=Botrytis sinoallii TaxID=1463999 RepID=UPI001900DD5E|nr:uncharacterized protein EAF02_010331 [Botrytis sinoallii]KAF7862782.1 hypothetical protein EAF02_010331 [Botrytis sinoallii]